VGPGRSHTAGRRATPVKEGRVGSVAFSPDGKTIAAGFSGDRGMGGVVLWDLAARTRLGRRATPRERGPCWKRGLQPRRQDHRGRIRKRSRRGVVLWTWPLALDWVHEPLPVKVGELSSVAFSRMARTIAARRRQRPRLRRWCCGTSISNPGSAAPAKSPIATSLGRKWREYSPKRLTTRPSRLPVSTGRDSELIDRFPLGLQCREQRGWSDRFIDGMEPPSRSH